MAAAPWWSGLPARAMAGLRLGSRTAQGARTPCAQGVQTHTASKTDYVKRARLLRFHVFARGPSVHPLGRVERREPCPEAVCVPPQQLVAAPDVLVGNVRSARAISAATNSAPAMPRPARSRSGTTSRSPRAGRQARALIPAQAATGGLPERLAPTPALRVHRRYDGPAAPGSGSPRQGRTPCGVDRRWDPGWALYQTVSCGRCRKKSLPEEQS